MMSYKEQSPASKNTPREIIDNVERTIMTETFGEDDEPKTITVKNLDTGELIFYENLELGAKLKYKEKLLKQIKQGSKGTA